VGEKDRIFVPLAHELGSRIPDSRVKVYEGIGHMLNLEAPERFREDLGAFLNEVESR
jgi:pimeloyl-ACP methyl ester carboxylesterase